MRLYPSGQRNAPPSSFIFHDGSRIDLREERDRLTVTFEDVAQSRRYTTRLPAPYDVTEVFADDTALPRLAGRTDAPGWWRDPEDGAIWVHVPQGLPTLLFRRGGQNEASE